MSNEENEKWIEAARENFDEACETANWSFAEDIIKDCRDNGFKDAADHMKLKLTHSRFHDR